MRKIIATFGLTFACLAPPASAYATSLYWNVGVNGIITSSTFAFDPDPAYPNGPSPYTLTCRSNCGTLEFQSTTTADTVFVNGQEYLNIGGHEIINLSDSNNPFIGETLSGVCMDDCPIGYNGVIDVYYFNAGNGTTDVYGPYPGSGNITADYEAFDSYGQPIGSYDYTAIYSTVSVSLVTNAAVPEPSTWALILLGFAGLGFASYRHGRRAIL